ncbi:hypothetical protein ABZV14_12120 [Streptosporangium canum]|uniref:hypothetical protein n=1 Tax=Streptosporangium canum TaxID=324952 RepID=UPI0033B6AB52
MSHDNGVVPSCAWKRRCRVAGLTAAHSDEVPLRLPLGREAVERISGVYRRGLEEVERWAETARGADFEGVPASVRPI